MALKQLDALRAQYRATYRDLEEANGFMEMLRSDSDEYQEYYQKAQRLTQKMIYLGSQINQVQFELEQEQRGKLILAIEELFMTIRNQK